MTRDELAKMARTCRDKRALRARLDAYFVTPAGAADLAVAPPLYGIGLPRQMTAADAAATLTEEGAIYLRKPARRKK